MFFSVKKVILNTQPTRDAIAARGIAPLQNHASPAGRLAHFITNWQKVTKDRWVLNTVTGYEIEFTSEPHQRQRPYPSQLNQSQQELVSQEITEMISKGAVTELQTPPEGGFFSTLFLVPKKDGGQRPVINLKNLNAFTNAPTLQNGGDPYPQEPAPKRGLASKSRPEGRLLFNPDKSTAQEVPMLPIQEQAISVQLSPLRPGLSPLGLYQDPEADSSSRTGAGDADDSLYRRYTPNGRDQGESQRPSIRPDIPHAMLGLHNKLGEDHFRTIPTPRVLGFCGGYHQHGAELPRTEDQEDSGGVPSVIRGRAYYSPRPLQINWQNECHEPSDTTSSPVLQEPSDGPCSSLETRQPRLQDKPGALSRQQGGAEVVGHTDGKVEWQDGASIGA